MSDLTDQIGHAGCALTYQYRGTRDGYMQIGDAARSTPVGYGYLGANGNKRRFRVQCAQYAGETSIYVVHPDDAGWLIPLVQRYMGQVEPIYARPQASIPVGGRMVQVPQNYGGAVEVRWLCPECVPASDMRAGGQRTWYRDGCGPCQITKRNTAFTSRYGYDYRAMVPWHGDTGQESPPSVCAALARQPGPQSTSQPPVCLPAPWSSVCNAAAMAQRGEYWLAFWADVGQAIQAYNAAAVKRSEQAKKTVASTPPPMPASAPVAPPPLLAPAPPGVNAVPAIMVGATVIAVSAILVRRRTSN